MIKIPEKIILIGGGDSIKKGITKGLWGKIKNKFTIGCNYNFIHFNPTITTFLDPNFYKKYKQQLDALPLVLAKEFIGIISSPKRFLFTPSENYDTKKGLATGFIYAGKRHLLTGIFSLSIAINLGCKEIYLLGFDFTRKGEGKTHYYQGELNHEGVGYTFIYDEINPNDTFKYFLREKDVKIYNVSLKSNINTFPKISYDKFFKELENSETYNQKELIELTKEIIRGFKCF